MASRNELNMRAASAGLDPSTIPNDSKLEQKILFLEKNSYAVTGTAPTTTLTSTGVAANNETFTIGSRVYTLKTALTSATAANEILIGAAATNTLDNIKEAINGTGTPGTNYGSSTIRNSQVTAGAKTATTLVIASTDTNASGLIATTDTLANFAFTAATLTNGVLGSIAQGTSTSNGPAGVSGEANTTL